MFPFQQANSNNVSFMNMMNSLKQSGSSDAIFKQMYNTNPRFRAFADSVRDMTPEQAFKQNGLDFSQFKGFRW